MEASAKCCSVLLMSLTLLNGLMTKSGFEPNFLMEDLCCEVRLGLVTYGGGVGIIFRKIG